MAWSRVQTVGSNGAAGTTTSTISATTAGNLLVAFAVASGVTPVISDSAGQSWSSTTLRTNTPGSTKQHVIYFVSTVDGCTSVTITGTGNVFLQVAEYTPGFPANYQIYPGSDTGFALTLGTSVGGSLGGSVPDGNLVLFGTAGNAGAASTFTVGTGITTIVGTVGMPNGSATCALGENLSCAANPVANFTIAPANDEGATAVVFTPSAITAAPSPAGPPGFFTGPFGPGMPTFADPFAVGAQDPTANAPVLDAPAFLAAIPPALFAGPPASAPAGIFTRPTTDVVTVIAPPAVRVGATPASPVATPVTVLMSGRVEDVTPTAQRPTIAAVTQAAVPAGPPLLARPTAAALIADTPTPVLAVTARPVPSPAPPPVRTWAGPVETTQTPGPVRVGVVPPTPAGPGPGPALTRSTADQTQDWLSVPVVGRGVILAWPAPPPVVCQVRDVTPLAPSSQPPILNVTPVGWVRPPLGGTVVTRSTSDPTDPVVGVKINMVRAGVVLPMPAPPAVVLAVRDVTPLQASASPPVLVTAPARGWLSGVVAMFLARTGAAVADVPPPPVLAPPAVVQPIPASRVVITRPVVEEVAPAGRLTITPVPAASAPAVRVLVVTEVAEQTPAGLRLLIVPTGSAPTGPARPWLATVLVDQVPPAGGTNVLAVRLALAGPPQTPAPAVQHAAAPPGQVPARPLVTRVLLAGIAAARAWLGHTPFDPAAPVLQHGGGATAGTRRNPAALPGDLDGPHATAATHATAGAGPAGRGGPGSTAGTRRGPGAGGST